MEITKRELLFSTIIVAVMVGLGILISNPILSNSREAELKASSSVQIDTPDKFDYIRRTNAGDFIAEGRIDAESPVSIPDIPGQYMEIKKVKERYTAHTRVRHTTDGKGNTRTYTEVYHTWDEVHTDLFVCDSLKFMNQTFPTDGVRFRRDLRQYKTIKESSSVRYVYYTYPDTCSGIMTGIADEKTYSDLRFRENMSIEKYLKSMSDKVSLGGVIFWIMWILLTIGAVVGFCAYENTWLED